MHVGTGNSFSQKPQGIALIEVHKISVTEVPAYRNMRISEVIHQRGEVTVITCIKWPFGMVGKVRGGG